MAVSIILQSFNSTNIYNWIWSVATMEKISVAGTTASSYEWADSNRKWYTYINTTKTGYPVISVNWCDDDLNNCLYYYYSNTSSYYPSDRTQTDYRESNLAINQNDVVYCYLDTGRLYNSTTGTSKYVKPFMGPAHIINMTANNASFHFYFEDSYGGAKISDSRYLVLPRSFNYNVKIPDLGSSKCFAIWNNNGSEKRTIITKDTTMLTISKSTYSGHDNYTLGSTRADFFGIVFKNSVNSNSFTSLLDTSVKFDTQIFNSSGTLCATGGDKNSYMDDGRGWTTYPSSLQGSNRKTATFNSYCFSNNWYNTSTAFASLLTAGYHRPWTNNDSSITNSSARNLVFTASITETYESSSYAIDYGYLSLTSSLNSNHGNFLSTDYAKHPLVRPCFKLYNNAESASGSTTIYCSNGSSNSSSISYGSWLWVPANDSSFYIVIKNSSSSGKYYYIYWGDGSVERKYVSANSTCNLSAKSIGANKTVEITGNTFNYYKNFSSNSITVTQTVDSSYIDTFSVNSYDTYIIGCPRNHTTPIKIKNNGSTTIYVKFYADSSHQSGVTSIAANTEITVESNFRPSGWSVYENEYIYFDISDNYYYQKCYSKINSIYNLSTNSTNDYIVNKTQNFWPNAPKYFENNYISQYNKASTSSDIIYFQGHWKTLTSDQINTITKAGYHYIGSTDDSKIGVSGTMFEIEGKINFMHQGSCQFAVFDKNSESSLTHLRCESSYSGNDSRNLKICCKQVLKNSTSSKVTYIFTFTESDGTKTFSYTLSPGETVTVNLPLYVKNKVEVKNHSTLFSIKSTNTYGEKTWDCLVPKNSTTTWTNDYTPINTGVGVNESIIMDAKDIADGASTILVNNKWKKAKCNVKINNEWKECTAYIWKDGAWHQTS